MSHLEVEKNPNKKKSTKKSINESYSKILDHSTIIKNDI